MPTLSDFFRWPQTYMSAIFYLTCAASPPYLPPMNISLARNQLRFTGPGGSLLVSKNDEVSRRLAMLIEGECEGLGPSKAAQKYDFTRQRYYQILADFLEQMVDPAGIEREATAAEKKAFFASLAAMKVAWIDTDGRELNDIATEIARRWRSSARIPGSTTPIVR